MTGDVCGKWRNDLQAWAIPEQVLAQAPESPWIHPVENFTPKGDLHVDVPSRLRALEALPDGGSVLDIGCGGGRAAFGLVPPAGSVSGVDHQQGMLDVFSHEAAARGVVCSVHLGDWPAVAGTVPVCDVVTCHHVLYNVQDLRPFLEALTAHARRRVVTEIPLLHPLSSLSGAWRHFWGLERPLGPTADDALACARSLGIDARMETFADPPPPARAVTDDDVRHTRVRLCLTADRDDDVRTWLEANPRPARELAALWWDVPA
ncbi:MAG: class I SAM-dependent methyltransferase [Actinomycetota bacterium]